MGGVGQTVVLNQKTPQPIVAAAESKAEGVTGSPDNDYALYLDLLYADGAARSSATWVICCFGSRSRTEETV